MSFSSNGVKFKYYPSRRNFLLRWLISGGEGILSVLFVVTMAGPMIFPQEANAALGVAKPLSYQGRLTNSTGSPYTGTYCMRFSVWDVGTGGTANPNQLWPLSYATPYSKTVTATNGVFDTLIGTAIGGDDDLSNFDFSTNDTAYLNVDVYNVAGASCTGGAWESLSPRQRLGAVAYARVAENLYGGNARIGTGAGMTSGNQKYLHLDKMTQVSVENTGDACPTGAVNGSVWYNSARTRALMCETNIIKTISLVEGIKEQSVAVGGEIKYGVVNLSGSNNITISQNGNTLQFSAPHIHNVTLSGNSTSAGAGYIQISSGVMTLAGGNNITLSQNGNAITISAGAGGGGGAALQGSGTYSQNTGTVQFVNSNGVTFGLSNNGVMTASVAAAGGGGAGLTRNMYDNMGGRDFITNVTNITALSQKPIFTPFYLDGDILVDRIALEMSRATSGSNLFTIQMAVYTQVNSTQLSRLASLQNTFSGTATASNSGVRQFFLNGIEAAGSSLTPGVYVMGAYFSAAATASMNYSIRGGQTVGPPVGIINAGANSNWTATSQLSSQYLRMFQGRYSSTSNGLPASIAASQIQGWTSAVPFYFRIQNT